MARFDIMPFRSPLGGTFTTRVAGMTASEAFDVGEPVGIVNAGTLTEPTDNGAEWTLAQLDSAGNKGGIACFGPGAASSAAQPTDRLNTNPMTNAAFASGDNIAYWPFNEGIEFITDNAHASGGGSAGSAPAITDIGEIYKVTYGSYGTPDAGWGIEQAAGVRGTDVCAVITDVLDSLKRPIRESGQTGVYWVFTIETATS